MIKIAVCDDDQCTVEQIEQYFEMLDDKLLEYEEFFYAEELEQYTLTNKAEFDVYILDIEMKEMTGVELAKRIRKDNSNALIIFLTNHSQYVYDVFQVVTFDFIVKPLTFEQFTKMIDKIEKYICVSKKSFVFGYRKNNFSISFQKIIWLEKEGRKVWIHTVEGRKYHCNMKLDDIWKQLNGDIFVQLNKSLIVNISKIDEITKEDVVLNDGTILYVSRNYRKELKRKHFDYLKEQI